MGLDSSTKELDDPARLAALNASQLMDSVAEPAFDRIARLGSKLLSAPTVLLSLVDADRQFFKAACGLAEPWATERQTPLSHSFCQHVATSGRPLLVSDARHDSRVSDNLAVRDLGVVAYLGVPVRTPNGQVLGSLCAIDGVARTWTSENQGYLRDLADIVETEIRLREEVDEKSELATLNALLAREYHHRVKNALAVSAALVQLSGKGSNSVEEVVKAAGGRLKALANAHDSLLFDEDAIALKTLLARLLQPYCLEGTLADIDGPDVFLHHQQVTPLCLFIHELATNSVKYGAYGSRGRVAVRWSVTSGQVVVLRWTEDFNGSSEGEDANAGFGSQLLKLSSSQLGGKYSREWADCFLVVSLEFPQGDQV